MAVDDGGGQSAALEMRPDAGDDAAVALGQIAQLEGALFQRCLRGDARIVRQSGSDPPALPAGGDAPAPVAVAAVGDAVRLEEIDLGADRGDDDLGVRRCLLFEDRERAVQ